MFCGDNETRNEMSTKVKTERSIHQLWAEFRFGVIGALLSNPPRCQELRKRLKELSETEWKHPVEERKLKLSLPTIERWYYKSLNQEKDPVGVLRRKLRSDSGTTRHLTPEIKDWLQKNYQQHPSWSGQLHCDNLCAWLVNNPSYGAQPSYATVLRYMKIKGWEKKMRVRSPFAPGRAAAEARLQSHEVRSFESEYVGGLFHLDFHHASRQIRTEKGELVTPLALCVIDDHSRLVCHLQWYWWEDTRSLVHGFIQALQKRGVPRALMSDNGKAMTSGEFTQGLSRLGISHETILAYSPYQNAKQESFWGTLEGRMMAMIEGNKNITMEELNSITQAWVEMEYNRAIHSETKQSPMERFLHGKSVLRSAPETSVLNLSFRRDEPRHQRRSDGTLSIDGKRFEIPASFRALPKITVRYAAFDLRQVHLIDPRTQAMLTPIYPLDRKKNAEGLRKRIGPPNPNPDAIAEKSEDVIPPLLQKIMSDYAASGLPPAYIVDATPYVSKKDAEKVGKLTDELSDKNESSNITEIEGTPS
jgi:transposase InsO family protein